MKTKLVCVRSPGGDVTGEIGTFGTVDAALARMADIVRRSPERALKLDLVDAVTGRFISYGPLFGGQDR